MRKSIQFVFVLVLFFGWCTTFAQYDQLSNGPIPKMKVQSIHNIVNQQNILATTALAYSGANSVTLTMPLPAGTPFTTLTSWAAPNWASGMAKGLDGNYYLTDVGPPVALFQVDPSTGTVTSIGSITGMGSDQPNGIAFNPANGMFYMVSSSSFYSLDIDTRVATLIGTFSITGLMIDLCFDAAGVCYAYEVNINPNAANAYNIDITTGALTALGYVGFTPNYGQGMGYDYETSTIYLSAFNLDAGTAQLRTMDPSTGMTTLLTDWGGAEQIDAFEPMTQVPNPCPIGAASNPNPPNGATGLPLNGNTASWTNGAGTVNVELWFGTAGNLTKVYDGAAITSYALPILNYGTTYYWRVVCKDGTCGTTGPTWNF